MIICRLGLSGISIVTRGGISEYMVEGVDVAVGARESNDGIGFGAGVCFATVVNE